MKRFELTNAEQILYASLHCKRILKSRPYKNYSIERDLEYADLKITACLSLMNYDITPLTDLLKVKP